MTNLNKGAIDPGNDTDPTLGIVTMTDTSAYKTIQVLPDETVADVAKRVFGANSELNRAKITANNDTVDEGPVSVFA